MDCTLVTLVWQGVTSPRGPRGVFTSKNSCNMTFHVQNKVQVLVLKSVEFKVGVLNITSITSCGMEWCV